MTDSDAVRACQAVSAAILDRGVDPPYHDAAAAKLRKEWPVLWRAIQDCMAVSRRVSRPTEERKAAE